MHKDNEYHSCLPSKPNLLTLQPVESNSEMDWIKLPIISNEASLKVESILFWSSMEQRNVFYSLMFSDKGKTLMGVNHRIHLTDPFKPL